MQNGPKLTHDQQLSLVAEVSDGEIYERPCAIHEDKAHEVDGYNSRFFKKAWSSLADLLANGLQRVIASVISEAQAGRKIAYNIILSHELVKAYTRKNISTRCCVKTVRYSIIINGEPSIPFSAAKWLRQGDPMSQFLFAIAMKYFSRCLNGLKKKSEFKYHPRCSKLGITHISFADDLLLFARGDVLSVMQLQQRLSQFYEVSGLQANQSKSSI
ncbi:uncharacterized protein LOC142167389 [Nicotiana tabacum]|uniref:Uncharacterized protein LOC142167389 n=1 Tax=Nicotiana tabacum TaxID=4097 RepID=A0AC58SFC2_TOBAC